MLGKILQRLSVFAYTSIACLFFYGTATGDWTAMNSGTAQHLIDVWGTSPDNVYAVGTAETILHYDGTDWSEINSGASIYYAGIWGSSESNVIIVGSLGNILRYDGATLNAMDRGTTFDLKGVWGSSDSNVFTVGIDGTILHYDGNVDDTWTAMNSGTTLPLWGVWGTSATDVYAASNNGTVFHYDGNPDGDWSLIATGSALNLEKGCAVSETDVFAVGSTGTIVHYDGDSWTQMNSSTTTYLYDTWCRSAINVLAVGLNGLILHYDGDTWSSMISGTTDRLYGVWGTDTGSVFAVGYNGTILQNQIPVDTTPPSASMIIDNGDNHTSEREVTITLSLLQEDATEVSGEIVTDIVWNIAGSPYTLVGNLQINSGVRLTIEDGVVVNNPGGYQILVYGTIQAEAVLNHPVVFNDVAVNVASAGTVIFDYAIFNRGHIRNNLGFEHFTITNCLFNETSYLRINARTDSYFDQNTLINAGYVELIAYTSSHDRDIYARWNSFYGKHPTLALKSCFKVSYEGSDRLVIHYNNFLDENNYGISLHSNTSTVYATNNYWGSTDPAVIATRINDSNDNPSILGTVQFEPLANVPYSIAQTPSEAVYMSFSNDGMTFSAWESYADSKTWTLTDGDGTKEVFAKLKDEAGNISTVSDSIILDTTAPSGTVIGTLDSGIWYWDLVASEWTQMAASTPTGDIAAGDFTSDGKADVASCWDSGLWYQDWATLSWIKVSGSAPNSLTAGDVTGDGQAEIIGTWSSGVWYWDVAASIWTKMTVFTPTGDIAAGDFTGDGKADVVSIWDNGLWYQDGATLEWTKVSNTAPTQLTAGDVTGDGRSEIIGTWSSGIWYWDEAASKWTQMYPSTPTGDIAAGDFTGDGKADVASCWSNGLWYQDGDTLEWTKVSNTAPTQVTAGDITGN